MREFQQKVRMADHRDALKFEYAVGAQPADLLQRLNEVKPDVVHFSGHSGAAGLAMEDNDGHMRILSPDELATLLSVSSRRIRLAILNACDSATRATALGHLEAAIGMEQSIDDEAAKSFAGQLYSSIAFGLPLSKAVDQAVLQVR
jgi:CHAT domain-containing protein